MMVRMPNWIPTRTVCLIACIFILIQSASGQPGFVSIACCSVTDLNDHSISWISDYRWYPDNSTCKQVSRAAANNPDYNVRSFRIDSGKRCYNLTTNKDQDYLIRSTFLLGDPVGFPESSFDVLIGITPIGVVDSSRDEEVESIFRASKEYVDFCLQHEQGNPYMSLLELRPLDDPEYLNGNASQVLKLVSRIDLGSDGNVIRYQDDLSDRIWRSPNDTKVILSQDPEVIRSNTTIPIGSTTVPVRVLQTALTRTDRLEFQHSDLDPQDYNYRLRFYFLELDDAVKPGQRQFNLYINNVTFRERFDILDNGSNYKEVNLDITANKSINVTLVKVPSNSSFGPMLNAYEILQMRQWQQETDQQDSSIMKNVREELLQDNKHNTMIESWSGDPCLPQPWPGLACQSINGISIVTKLDVSSRQLDGPIPPSIANLAYLTELNISCNQFTGQIPKFPPTCVLTSVDLSHNDLTGSIPESLISLPKLTILNYGCNPNLTSDLPISNSSRFYSDHGRCDIQETGSNMQKLIISSIACGSFLVTAVIGIALVRTYRQKFTRKSMLEMKPHPMTKTSTDNFLFKSINIETYTLEVIDRATCKYKTLIGEGGFGSVYRGTLPDGQEVAVKVRSATSTQGTREFENELDLLSAIRHENLVPLLGYCWEKDQQILVYPFMSNGSLQDRLYGEASKRKTLDWPTRLSIALGAARGLTHLHTFYGRCIIHRDVKSSNILLDHTMTAKMADFGFSKYAPQEGDSGASLEVRGTAGYLDPEYYSTQHLSAKSDVFSFGVVLLEIISGREPLNIHRPRPEWSLVEWAKTYIRESKIEEIVDPSIKGMYHAEAMWRVVEVALACIEPFSTYRPTTEDVVRELEDALIIENNASEYMKSIDSMYSIGGSNRYSIVIDKKTVLTPPPQSPTEPSPYNEQSLAPPGPR